MATFKWILKQLNNEEEELPVIKSINDIFSFELNYDYVSNSSSYSEYASIIYNNKTIEDDMIKFSFTAKYDTKIVKPRSLKDFINMYNQNLETERNRSEPKMPDVFPYIDENIFDRFTTGTTKEQKEIIIECILKIIGAQIEAMTYTFGKPVLRGGKKRKTKKGKQLKNKTIKKKTINKRKK
jgi:hypothetical protein